MRRIAYFYRLATWRYKVNGLRVLLYPLFGFAFAGEFNLVLMVLFLFAVLGLLMSSYALNDFYDWQLLGEKNYMSGVSSLTRMDSFTIVSLCMLPLVAAVPFVVYADSVLRWLFLVIAVIVTAYSVPPVRFKEKKLLGVVVPPIAMVLVFIEACIIGQAEPHIIVVLSTLLLLFQSYAEALHMLDDTLLNTEVTKLKTVTIKAFMKVILCLYIVISMYLIAYIDVVFFVSLIAGFIRLNFAQGLGTKNIAYVRKHIWRPEWFLYEFLTYGLLGILGYFKV